MKQNQFNIENRCTVIKQSGFYMKQNCANAERDPD